MFRFVVKTIIACLVQFIVVLVPPRNNLKVQIKKLTLELHFNNPVTHLKGKVLEIPYRHLRHSVHLVEGSNDVNHLTELYCTCIRL